MFEESTPTNISLATIIQDINRMVTVDQDMREQNLVDANHWDDEVDKTNTARMKEIISAIGWPTISQVGTEVATNAWLLVQHADHDPDFQERCLTLMKSLPADEVNQTDIAFLEDRVRVNRGEPQLYDTQFRQINGQHVPKPIEDEANVDTRRRAMGMGTMAERIAEMYEKYPNP